MGYRKIERIEYSLAGGPYWNECGFSELTEKDVFKITDLDDNGKIAIDGEDGSRIFIAMSEPYVKNDVYTIETEEYEGTEDEVLTSHLL